jgi:hypothetical protein
MFKVGENDKIAECITCRTKINVEHKGKNALTTHLQTPLHQTNLKRVQENSKLDEFFANPTDKVFQDKVSAAELALAYHSVIHHQSFSTSDCTTKLNAAIFNDSSIAKSISLARTKSEAIIKGILGPHSISEVVKILTTVPYIGVSTDGSNHKDQKIFPIKIQYFNENTTGLEHKLIEVKSLPDEKAITITKLIVDTLKSLGIFQKCVAFGSDNCPTNFGSSDHSGENNVFALLSEHFTGLEGTGCPAHIGNNTIQNAVDNLVVDIESCLAKLYGHFSIHTLRVEKLKTFCEDFQCTYKQVLKNSKTRWLSLNPCITRLLELFEPLKSYFLGLAKPPIVLKSFFENPLSEAYLYFVHSLSNAFHDSVLKIEKDENSVIETVDTLQTILNILKIRLEAKFLPLSVQSILNKNKHLKKEVEQFRSECIDVYKDRISYLQKWMKQFKSFKKFAWMNL